MKRGNQSLPVHHHTSISYLLNYTTFAGWDIPDCLMCGVSGVSPSDTDIDSTLLQSVLSNWGRAREFITARCKDICCNKMDWRPS